MNKVQLGYKWKSLIKLCLSPGKLCYICGGCWFSAAHAIVDMHTLDLYSVCCFWYINGILGTHNDSIYIVLSKIHIG